MSLSSRRSFRASFHDDPARLQAAVISLAAQSDVLKGRYYELIGRADSMQLQVHEAEATYNLASMRVSGLGMAVESRKQELQAALAARSVRASAQESTGAYDKLLSSASAIHLPPAPRTKLSDLVSQRPTLPAVVAATSGADVTTTPLKRGSSSRASAMIVAALAEGPPSPSTPVPPKPATDTDSEAVTGGGSDRLAECARLEATAVELETQQAAMKEAIGVCERYVATLQVALAEYGRSSAALAAAEDRLSEQMEQINAAIAAVKQEQSADLTSNSRTSEAASGGTKPSDDAEWEAAMQRAEQQQRDVIKSTTSQKTLIPMVDPSGAATANKSPSGTMPLFRQLTETEDTIVSDLQAIQPANETQQPTPPTAAVEPEPQSHAAASSSGGGPGEALAAAIEPQAVPVGSALLDGPALPSPPTAAVVNAVTASGALDSPGQTHGTSGAHAQSERPPVAVPIEAPTPSKAPIGGTEILPPKSAEAASASVSSPLALSPPEVPSKTMPLQQPPTELVEATSGQIAPTPATGPKAAPTSTNMTSGPPATNTSAVSNSSKARLNPLDVQASLAAGNNAHAAGRGLSPSGLVMSEPASEDERRRTSNARMPTQIAEAKPAKGSGCCVVM